MGFYYTLVVIHILSAIIGLGPGFILTFLVLKAETMTDLRIGYVMRKRIHIFVMIGGALLLLTGIGMGLLRPYLFFEGWYTTSLLLYLVALAASPLLLRREAKPINQFLATYKGEEIPQTYYDMSKRLYLYEHITNAIFIIIILLMILKPF